MIDPEVVNNMMAMDEWMCKMELQHLQAQVAYSVQSELITKLIAKI